MLVENYSNSRSLQTHSAAEAIFSDLRVNNGLASIVSFKVVNKNGFSPHRIYAFNNASQTVFDNATYLAGAGPRSKRWLSIG